MIPLTVPQNAAAWCTFCSTSHVIYACSLFTLYVSDDSCKLFMSFLHLCNFNGMFLAFDSYHTEEHEIRNYEFKDIAVFTFCNDDTSAVGLIEC